uniref:ATP11 protein n=1 Tax=Arundo donax TaxID=35708 RepID=A0A0A9D6M6_ARUDO
MSNCRVRACLSASSFIVFKSCEDHVWHLDWDIESQRKETVGSEMFKKEHFKF